MTISRTPVRISFAGGGSDIYHYYKTNPGSVVSATINKYIYITVNKKFDDLIRVSYSKTELVRNLNDIRHPLIRECLKATGIEKGIEITSISDIPSEGTGLGSSSSYTVGLLHALLTYKKKRVTPSMLAQLACHIEIEVLKNPIGKQDQYIAAFGGFRQFRFSKNGNVTATSIHCRDSIKNSLEKHLLLLYTGLTRSSNKILSEQIDNIAKDISYIQKISSMTNIARRMAKSLNRNDISELGSFLDRSWLLKQQLAKSISSQQIDRWYKIAKKYGAEGGKILGAGGGGFLLLFAEPEYHSEIKKVLSMLQPVAFRFENEGSKIIYNDA